MKLTVSYINSTQSEIATIDLKCVCKLSTGLKSCQARSQPIEDLDRFQRHSEFKFEQMACTHHSLVSFCFSVFRHLF